MILYSALSAARFRPFLWTVLRMDVRGGEHVPATGPVILVANHESIFDPWVLGVITERQIRYLAKAELWRYPVLRALMNGFGAIPIERGGGDILAMRNGAEILRRGAVLGVFPQGTTRLDRPRRFHRGAARLALQTGAPLVPVRLRGTRGILRPGLPAVTVEALPPIAVEPACPTIAAARALTAALEETLVG